MPTLLENFAAATISHRLKAGITPEILAAKAGVSPSTIHNLEQAHANPTLMTMEAVSAALGLSLPEMLSPKKPDEPSRKETVLGWLFRTIFR